MWQRAKNFILQSEKGLQLGFHDFASLFLEFLKLHGKSHVALNLEFSLEESLLWIQFACHQSHQIGVFEWQSDIRLVWNIAFNNDTVTLIFKYYSSPFPFTSTFPLPFFASTIHTTSLPLVSLTLKAKTPLTFLTRLAPSFFSASSMPSKIKVDLKFFVALKHQKEKTVENTTGTSGSLCGLCFKCRPHIYICNNKGPLWRKRSQKTFISSFLRPFKGIQCLFLYVTKHRHIRKEEVCNLHLVICGNFIFCQNTTGARENQNK